MSLTPTSHDSHVISELAVAMYAPEAVAPAPITLRELDFGSRRRNLLLTMQPGTILSWRLHHHHWRHLTAVFGTGRILISPDDQPVGGEGELFPENTTRVIQSGTAYMLKNDGVTHLEICITCVGTYTKPDDALLLPYTYMR